MARVEDTVRNWVQNVRDKATADGISEADLNELLASVDGPKKQVRQKLLYLHSSGIHVNSLVIAIDLRDATRTPTPVQLSPTPKFPYDTVHDAIVDGWRVIQFPSQHAPFDDREIDILGYEFILEKLEEYDD